MTLGKVLLKGSRRGGGLMSEVPLQASCLSVNRNVDIRQPGKGNSNSHGARPVHQIISTIQWIRTSRLSIKNSLLVSDRPGAFGSGGG